MQMTYRKVVLDKEDWISLFRSRGNYYLSDILHKDYDCKKKAAFLNKKLKNEYEIQIESLLAQAQKEGWDNHRILNEILVCTYASYVAMLEFRNTVWPYEYMAFARRIGELWEPFCKLPFSFPTKRLALVNPPDFDVVQNNIKADAECFFNSLPVAQESKDRLLALYEIPWSLVDSGGIQLALDLHFEQDGIRYNCDMKSGFSSNEKGNTNRLLLVGSIYASLSSNEQTILFVRQEEAENNHYLQTLKNSPYWHVYCAADCYEAMRHFTGFDMRSWLDENANWVDDFSSQFREHLKRNDLLKYLTW